MGGCCCCYSRRAESRSPVCYYCPQTLQEHDSLSSNQAPASAFSAALLVDTNLETSFPDTYQAPPVPLPYELDRGFSQTSPGVLDNSDSGTVVTCESMKDTEYKSETDCVSDSPKTCEPETLKSTEPIISTVDEEDICPTCFEEYDDENPRIITKCDHHFHLSCILEWMERSDSCPICNQEMIFNQNVNG